MREKMLLGVVAVLAGIVGTWLFYVPFASAPAPRAVTADRPVASTPAIHGAVSDRVGTSRDGDGFLDTPSPAGDGQRVDVMSASAADAEFVFDFSRLSDPAYETDVDLVRLADRYGLTASCLLAQVRLRSTGSPAGDACNVAELGCAARSVVRIARNLRGGLPPAGCAG